MKKIEMVGWEIICKTLILIFSYIGVVPINERSFPGALFLGGGGQRGLEGFGDIFFNF